MRLGFVRKHKIHQEWRRRHTSRRIEHPSPCTFVPLKQDPIKWSPSLVASFGSRVLLEALLSLDLSLARTSSTTTLKPATRSESRTTCSGCHTFMPAKRAAANIDFWCISERLAPSLFKTVQVSFVSVCRFCLLLFKSRQTGTTIFSTLTWRPRVRRRGDLSPQEHAGCNVKCGAEVSRRIVEREKYLVLLWRRSHRDLRHGSPLRRGGLRRGGHVLQ